MKTSLITALLGAASAVALIASAPVSAKEPASGKITLAQLAYKPPMRGAPSTRVGGGSRGAGFTLSVNVLAPSETGLTLQAQPTVYWFASEDIDKPVELTVISTESLRAASKPALEITLQPPVAKGMHALRLADHGVRLKPGVEYQWFVAVVRNPKQRSNDVLAGGTIKHVSADAGVESQLKRSAQAQWPAVYAEAGIWYDAIDQLSRQIDADRGNRRLREDRAALLEQVGLREAAAFDRGG